MELLQLVANQVKLGAPLLFGVRDEHGRLLLARGQLIGTEAQLKALLSRGIYADREEIDAITDRRALTERQRLTLFDLWEQAIWRLERLLKSVGQKSGFAARCDEFAIQLMSLVQRDPRHRHLPVGGNRLICTIQIWFLMRVAIFCCRPDKRNFTAGSLYAFHGNLP